MLNEIGIFSLIMLFSMVCFYDNNPKMFADIISVTFLFFIGYIAVTNSFGFLTYPLLFLLFAYSEFKHMQNIYYDINVSYFNYGILFLILYLMSR
jgi:predicted metal-binding membrane protein